MKNSITTETSFADMMILDSPKPSFLQKIDQIIDWKQIDKTIKKHYRKTASADGRPAYPGLTMFKILLLQRWYNLSDPAMEEALYDRISFIRFSGLSVVSDKPDETTICRFRNALNEKNLYQKLLKKINKQLEQKNLLIKTGAIVDATLVESSRRPKKVIHTLPEDRQEKEESSSSDYTVEYSADTDARWLKKGKKAYYGYKVHMATDKDNGFILSGHVTGANRSDTKEFQNVVEQLNLPKGSPVLADKAYPSKENRRYLQKKGLLDLILFKAVRGKPLTTEQLQMNKAISQFRYKIEQCFGTLKRTYQFQRARYLGIPKIEMEFYLNAMAFNLKKAVSMIS